MKFIHGQLQLSSQLNASVITLGNFDGVHLGHQQLLATLKQQANIYKAPAVVISFEPPPLQYFKKTPIKRLMFFREKWLTLQQYNIDYFVCLHFAKQLAELSAEAFVKDILLAQLGMQAVVVGNDFRFGANRKGDVNLLRQMGNELGFAVIEQKDFLLNDQRVSSTLIRETLSAGNIETANHFLGRDFFICGRVVAGDQRGREWGFPTANINLAKKLPPLSGIFVASVEGVATQALPAAVSLGVRPMFDGDSCLLEVFILDFSQNIYGKNIKVNFLHKIRDEAKFDSIDELIAQIHLDVEVVRNYFVSSENCGDKN